MIEQNGTVIPIEIKSGKDYYRHHALDNVLNHTDYGIQEGYVFCNGNTEKDGKTTYYPIYMLMFLQKSEMPDEILCDSDFPDLNSRI